MKINFIQPAEKTVDKTRLATVTMQAPANLWSSQVLTQRRTQITNNFDIKLLEALSRCNKYANKIKFEDLSTKVTNDIDVAHFLRITDVS